MYEPKSDLGKLLRVIVEEVGSQSPRAFEKIHVDNAIRQADEAADLVAQSGGPPILRSPPLT